MSKIKFTELVAPNEREFDIRITPAYYLLRHYQKQNDYDLICL